LNEYTDAAETLMVAALNLASMVDEHAEQMDPMPELVADALERFRRTRDEERIAYLQLVYRTAHPRA
jgi:hypothetical protein